MMPFLSYSAPYNTTLKLRNSNFNFFIYLIVKSTKHRTHENLSLLARQKITAHLNVYSIHPRFYYTGPKDMIFDH